MALEPEGRSEIRVVQIPAVVERRLDDAVVVEGVGRIRHRQRRLPRPEPEDGRGDGEGQGGGEDGTAQISQELRAVGAAPVSDRPFAT